MTTDEAFEALCAVCGIDWEGAITSDQRGRVNAALKQLRSVYEDDVVLPMMIHERASAWHQVYPAIPLTPQALTGNWSSILDAAEETRKQAQRERKVTNAWAKNGCETCMDDHMVIVGTDKAGGDLAVPCWTCSGGVMPLEWGRM